MIRNNTIPLKGEGDMSEQVGKKQKILVLSVSAGAGHVRAAEAVKASAQKWFNNVEVVHVDVMELVSKLFRKIYAESYISIVESHPALWGYMYDKTDQEKADSVMSKIRIAIERLNTHKLSELLEDVNPDHVICTHFLPAQLLSRKKRKGSFSKPVWVVVTDFDVHGLWIHDHIDGYFAANEEVAWRMAARGIPKSVIHVTGIPIMPVFGEPKERNICAAEFGLDPLKKTFIMMSGGAGVGGIETLAEDLLKLPHDFQLIGLAGRNEVLLKRLQVISLRLPGRLYPVPFTKVIERLMAASDVAITKPGGLTTSECLAVGLPMIVVSPIPGQEERNADFLLENGAAMKAYDGGALTYRVSLLLREPGRIERLQEHARSLGKPEAGRAVLETVLY
jgi:processive 1,2-diacylglycerol beta-glucosyltransferase